MAHARRRPGPSLRRGRRAARSRIGSLYPLKQLGTGVLLKAATLEVDESALTGESLPVAKGTEPVKGAGTPLGDRTGMVYMNTSVTRGAGEFVVTATGMATEVGHISGMLAEEQDVKTPLARQMDRLTGQILVIAGIALVASMALNLARGETFIAVFNAAVAFAIAAIPGGCPRWSRPSWPGGRSSSPRPARS